MKKYGILLMICAFFTVAHAESHEPRESEARKRSRQLPGKVAPSRPKPRSFQKIPQNYREIIDDRAFYTA